MKKILAIVAVAALMLIVIAPAAIGIAAQKRQEALADPATGSPAVRIDVYRRGWFGSTSTVAYDLSGSLPLTLLRSFTGEAPKRAELVVDTVIRHGPMAISGIDGLGRLSLASSRSRLTLVVGDLRYPLPGDLLGRAGLGGESVLRFLSGAGAVDDGDRRITFSAIDLVLRGHGASGVLTGSIDGLAYGSSATSTALGSVSVDGQFDRSRSGAWSGRLSTQADTLLAALKRSSVSVTGLELDADLRPSRTAANFRLAVRADEVSGRTWQGRGANLVMRIDGLDSTRSLAAAVAADGLRALLPPGAQLRLESLHVPTPHGDLSADFDVSVPPDLTEPPAGIAWLLALDGQGRIAMPRPLAYRLSSSNQAFAKAFGSLRRMRLLRSSGNRYSLEAAYRGGRLTINGFPVAVPFVAQ